LFKIWKPSGGKRVLDTSTHKKCKPLDVMIALMTLEIRNIGERKMSLATPQVDGKLSATVGGAFRK